MSYKKPPGFETIELSKLFIDGVNEEISCGNIRRPQTSPGYQRDPYLRSRERWIDDRVPHFNPAMFLTLEVSKREDGRYAIIDGGGRWLLAQKCKKTQAACRVHYGMSRQEEAELFYHIDRERKKLGTIDQYSAALASGNPAIVEIDEAIGNAYKVTKGHGAAGFDGVNALLDIYLARGAALISKTGFVVANTWGGRTKTGEYNGTRVPGNMFAAVALVLDANPKAEGPVRKALSKMSLPDLTSKVERRLGGVKGKTIARMELAADEIAKASNRHASDPSEKVDVRDLRSSTLRDALQRQAGARTLLKAHHNGTET